MRRPVVLILVFLLAVSLCGCKKANYEESQNLVVNVEDLPVEDASLPEEAYTEETPASGPESDGPGDNAVEEETETGPGSDGPGGTVEENGFTINIDAPIGFTIEEESGSESAGPGDNAVEEETGPGPESDVPAGEAMAVSVGEPGSETTESEIREIVVTSSWERKMPDKDVYMTLTFREDGTGSMDSTDGDHYDLTWKLENGVVKTVQIIKGKEAYGDYNFVLSGGSYQLVLSDDDSYAYDRAPGM